MAGVARPPGFGGKPALKREGEPGTIFLDQKIVTLGPNSIRQGSGWFALHNGADGVEKPNQRAWADAKPHLFTVEFDRRRASGCVPRINRFMLSLDPVRFVQVGGHGLLDAPGEPPRFWFLTDRFRFNAVSWYLNDKYGLGGGSAARMATGWHREPVRVFGSEYCGWRILMATVWLCVDGLADGTEVNRYKTSPLKPDTDNDGLKAEELGEPELTRGHGDRMHGYLKAGSSRNQGRRFGAPSQWRWTARCCW